MNYRYFYDCEFIEDGRTIDLVSIGVVDEHGREFYAVSTEFDPTAGRAVGDAATCSTSCPRRATRPGVSRERIRDDAARVPGRAAAGPAGAARWSCGPGTPRTTTWPSPSCGAGCRRCPGRFRGSPRTCASSGTTAAARRCPTRRQQRHDALVDARHNLARWRVLTRLSRPAGRPSDAVPP